MKPESEGDDHEDIKEILCKPGQNETSKLYAHPLNHQDGEHDVYQVEDNHEPTSSFHGCIHISLKQGQEELGRIPTIQTVADVDDGEDTEEDGSGCTCLTGRLKIIIVVPR